MSDTDISRALKDARRIFKANGEAFAMAGGLPARLDNVVIGVIARALIAERRHAPTAQISCTRATTISGVTAHGAHRRLVRDSDEPAV